MESYEAFVVEEVKAGASIVGLYPCTKDENKKKYEEWRKRTGR